MLGILPYFQYCDTDNMQYDHMDAYVPWGSQQNKCDEMMPN